MKILALQLKRIGDLILTTPALWKLRQELPEAHITLVTDAGSRELLPAMDYVDDALTYSRRGGNGALWRRLVLRGFDVCLDFTGNDRSVFFTVLSKAPKRIAFKWVQRSKVRPIFFTEFVDSSVRQNHTVNHYLHLLRPLRIMAEEAPPITLHLPDWTEKKGQQLLSECGLATADRAGAPFVLVHPGTARPEKYWLPERWAEVMLWCERELGLPCVITGSSDPVEQEHIAKIKAAFVRHAHLDPHPQSAKGSSSSVCDLSGRLDLLTLAALTKNARLVLSVDSAAMHLAAAFTTPQVALFGPTNPFHWQPRHSRAALIVAGVPRLNPILKPQQRGAPMSEIVAESVIGAISSLFSAQPASSTHGSTAKSSS